MERHARRDERLHPAPGADQGSELVTVGDEAPAECAPDITGRACQIDAQGRLRRSSGQRPREGVRESGAEFASLSSEVVLSGSWGHRGDYHPDVVQLPSARAAPPPPRGSFFAPAPGRD